MRELLSERWPVSSEVSMRVNTVLSSDQGGYQGHTAVESNDERHWFAINDPLFFRFWGGSEFRCLWADMLVQGCFYVHHVVLTTHGEANWWTGQQTEWIASLVLAGYPSRYVWAHTHLISDFLTAPGRGWVRKGKDRKSHYSRCLALFTRLFSHAEKATGQQEEKEWLEKLPSITKASIDSYSIMLVNNSKQHCR